MPSREELSMTGSNSKGYLIEVHSGAGL